jgi:ATP-dependent Clp protease ATP-binding subunit ClpC
MGQVIMSTGSDTQKDWFDWAEASLANWKCREAEWHDSFSASARQVLELATQAALSLKHGAVGAEHLLAAVLKLNSGRTAAALRQAGLTLPALREEIESECGVSEEKQVNPSILYTPRCKGIIQRAQARVRGLKDVRIEVEDLLLEVLAEKEGLPARIFRKRSINVEEIKNVVTRQPCE